MVMAHPDVNAVYCVDTQAWRKKLCSKTHLAQVYTLFKTLRANEYDVVFDLQGNIKSGLICSLTKGKAKVGFGYKSVSELPNLLFTSRRFNPPLGKNICADYLYLVQSFFKDETLFENKGILLKVNFEQQHWIKGILEEPKIARGIKIMVCPGSAWKNKQVESQILADFLKHLQKDLQCSFLFAWGNAEEKKTVLEFQGLFPDSSVVLDRLPLPVLQNLMDKMNWVVAMDSLPLHLAGTTSTSTFSVFGPSLAAKFKPEGEQHISLQGRCPYGRTFPKRCPILRTCPTGSCIRDLTGKDLYETFKQRQF